MNIREIEHGSDDYRKECELRDEVLRKPLGLSLHEEDLEGERDQIHFGLFDESGEVQACAVAVPLSSEEAKIRQVAVRADSQGQGLGQELMKGVEEKLTRRGITRLSLHVRVKAVGFYRRLGYQVVGCEFMELGIPHLRMEKVLDGRASSNERGIPGTPDPRS